MAIESDGGTKYLYESANLVYYPQRPFCVLWATATDKMHRRDSRHSDSNIGNGGRIGGHSNLWTCQTRSFRSPPRTVLLPGANLGMVYHPHAWAKRPCTACVSMATMEGVHELAVGFSRADISDHHHQNNMRSGHLRTV